MLGPVNLLEELCKLEKVKPDLSGTVAEWLREDEQKEKDIRNRLKKLTVDQPLSHDIPGSSVFSRKHIRTLAIQYRLRFLPASQFRPEIPSEAVWKIRDLEKKHECTFHDFRILAPVSMFNLKDPHADPLLFAALGGDRYVFIHKWGNDLSSFRKILALPFRSFNSYLVFLVCLSALINLCIPSAVIAAGSDPDQVWNIRAFLMVHVFLLLSGLSMFFFFSRGRGLSELEWNERYSK